MTPTDPTPASDLPQENGGKTAAPVRQVRHISWWRYVLLMPVYWIARAWGASLRFRESPQSRESFNTDLPVIMIVWHNRLFLSGEICRRYRPGKHMCGLVSASNDGAWLAAFYKLHGFSAVRGSSSWRGMTALRELLAESRSGSDIGVTPDGPRGPRYEFKAGTLLVMRRTKMPLILISARFTSAWRLKSWDGFYIPLPFSTVEFSTEFLPGYEAIGEDDDQAASKKLEAKMMALTRDE